jgi:hypothetical protein
MRWRTAFLAIVFVANFANAQSSAPAAQSKTVNRPPAVSDKAAKDKGASEKKERESERRTLAVIQVRAFASRISTFQDAWIRSLATAQLASVLWKDDQAYASQLFSKALDLPVAEKGSKPEKNKLSVRDVAELRSKILEQVARCDPALAERLTKEYSERDVEGASSIDKSQAAIENAYSVINDDYKRAADIAERSLDGGVSPFIAQLLKQLRQKDSQSADALFLQTLQRLSNEAVVDGNTLLLLGTYVFSSPRVDQNDPMAIAMIGVGRLVVPDISVERPGVPPQIVRAYLATAGSILTRQVASTTQRELYYVTGQLLLPMTQRFASDLIPVIGAATQARASGVAPALSNSATYEQLSHYAPKGFEERLREADETSNPEARDLLYFLLMYDRWIHHDFINARAVTAKISDDKARPQLEVIIDFGEGAQELEKQDLVAAEGKARKLSNGIERSLLWLALSKSASGSGGVDRRYDYLNEALTAAANVSDARRPFLMLTVASQFTKVDAVRARVTLAEAVKEFNKQESKALGRAEWQQRIEVGKLSRNFPVKVKGVEINFELALRAFTTESEMTDTIATMSRLTDERLLSRALLTMGAIMLK